MKVQSRTNKSLNFIRASTIFDNFNKQIFTYVQIFTKEHIFTKNVYSESDSSKSTLCGLVHLSLFPYIRHRVHGPRPFTSSALWGFLCCLILLWQGLHTEYLNRPVLTTWLKGIASLQAWHVMSPFVVGISS